MLYHEAAERLGNRTSRKVGNNTYLERIGPRQIALRLHATRILTWDAGGTVRYDSGGWKTVTTKDRLNAFGPVRIYQEGGAWFARNGEGSAVCFADGLTYHPARGIRNAGKDPRPLRKKVNAYSERFMIELYAGRVPMPSGGDCWFCVMRDEAGTPLGELNRNREHLREHLREGYYVPALLFRAVEVFANAPAYRDHVARMCGAAGEEGREAGFFKSDDRGARKTVKRALTRYILRQLGEVS